MNIKTLKEKRFTQLRKKQRGKRIGINLSLYKYIYISKVLGTIYWKIIAFKAFFYLLIHIYTSATY